MHKHAVALLLGVYNFVRKHTTLGTSPAVAAGLEEKPWSLERVAEMTEAYWQPKTAHGEKGNGLAEQTGRGRNGSRRAGGLDCR